MKTFFLRLFFLISINLFGQENEKSPFLDSISNIYSINGSQRIKNNLERIDQGITIGGYGEITYNQPKSKNGELDVQRLVLLFGYKFDDRVQFITEIEFEHVKEVYVEQAFVNYSISRNLNIKGGLMLIPMGITNEYHEPTTFNGVERPSMDGKIIPTTWREIGLGASGRIDDIGVKYQAYLFNGFLSHDGSVGKLKGTDGLRGGRQKGAKSSVDKFNLSAKIDFYNIPGLKLGLAGYFGRTQASEGSEAPIGSDIGVSMIGIDGRYNLSKFSMKAQYINAKLSDTELYNPLTGKDLGSTLNGYYFETSYNVLSLSARQKLDLFIRYEDFDTHAEVSGSLSRNPGYHRKEFTYGFSYHIAPGAVFKIDYQNKKTDNLNSSISQFNMGLGVWF